ncbi:regulatory signaling modulator protein AmpE [Aliikangiella maris]|uniref:Regulatory signaling modulator protein AmpE n=2 Tax=Aliikangiella maris TaxID=3162458 RepID=A0ABV2BTX3_9GAMM
MTLISVLLVFALEFYFKWGSKYRKFNWFEQYQSKIVQALGEQSFFYGWTKVWIVLLLPVLLLYLFINLFDGGLYALIMFIMSCGVLFLSLGPKPLNETFNAYFLALDRGDSEAAFLCLKQESLLDGLPQSEELVRDATRAILTESQSRYFGVLFWFIFLGPFGALIYRLAHEYRKLCLLAEDETQTDLIAKVLHWFDWAPARLTSILFLLGGDFVNGFNRVRDYFTDTTASSRLIICETGMAALNADMRASNGDVQENKDALAMVDRTVIIYLVVTAALTPLAFW